MTYDAFVDAVQTRLEAEDRDAATSFVTVTLEALGEILYRSERDKLGAPLPQELSQLLHASTPEHTREKVERLTATAFLDRVQARADLNREEARTVTSAVVSVLDEAVGDAVLSEVGRKLPPSYAEIFPFVSSPSE